MDSDLFQVRSSTFHKTYRWVLVTWGFLLRHFQPSVGLVLWEYQMSSLIWVIGHLATSGHPANMPKAKYMVLKMSLAEARVKADLLQTQMLQKGCTIIPGEFQAISDELPQVLAYMSCISKTACFLVNCTPLSLQFGLNEEPKGSNGSHPSECDYQTPPSKLDTAPFWCTKPQPIRGLPTIEPMMFRRRQ